MATRTPASVDEYLARFDPPVRAKLEQLRRTIRRALPRAEEVISYAIPAYRLHGVVVIFFAGWKAHLSIYPATGSVTTVFKRELAAYAVSKGTIRFPLSAPLPLRLIAGVARLRAREAAERAETRTARPKQAARRHSTRSS